MYMPWSWEAFIMADGSFTKHTLRKPAYSNKLKILPPKKNENFQLKILIFFIFLLNTEIVRTKIYGFEQK